MPDEDKGNAQMNFQRGASMIGNPLPGGQRMPKKFLEAAVRIATGFRIPCKTNT
jgi:hypothetical protein